MVLICMQKTIIKNPMLGSRPPGIQRQKKNAKEEKIEGERKKKKENQLRWKGGTSPGPIRRDRRAPVITNPPLTTYADEYSFPRAILNQISHR